jgi:hypothetical protein
VNPYKVCYLSTKLLDKKIIQVVSQLTSLPEGFKSIVDYWKGIITTSQKQISLEIYSNSVVKIGINQPMISKMCSGMDILKCNNTMYWKRRKIKYS